ncbi:hypothetical protein [Polluticoccus soli]|uniref:hypothetical protein n=1 Tax=Polluticoccus soli TaxID=3034150 RepID=UPI0023E16EC7|nr:hypothetical protein [Flavipsychrobacter sp. JY13-12]
MDDAVQDEIFQSLKKMLEPYAPKMDVKADSEESFYLDCKKEVKKGYPMFFGAVRRGKSYISYYLMPVYAQPSLLEGMSPELKKRMQGKSCFNFKKPEPALFEELNQLTKRGFECYKKDGWVD